MMLKFLIFLTVAWGLSGCDHCIKLCQYNFDYVPLLQDDYCKSDSACENFLREVSFRYLSGKIQNNPCMHESYKSDCSSFSVKICSDMLQTTCSKGFLAIEPEDNTFTLQQQLKSLEQEGNSIEQELKQELARQKQRYLRMINKLSELQIEI